MESSMTLSLSRRAARSAKDPLSFFSFRVGFLYFGYERMVMQIG